jgi:3-hydroxyisobutyrate dehydrogenase-like beta-hydroxyacid dehydrogenase
MNDSPIGLVGVGLLGTALAERMIAGGLAVVGFDIAAERREKLRSLGGRAAPSVVDLAAECAKVVFCLPDSKVVLKVAAELSSAFSVGSLVIDATTGDPQDTEQLQALLAQPGVGYVTATIAGSSEQVRRGEAVAIVGASSRDHAWAEPVLATWTARRFFVGEPRQAAQLKLIVNLVLGLNRAVLAEGLSLARACGIDLVRTLEVLKATPAYSAAMETKGPKMVVGDYAPQAKLAQHLKDVRLIQQLAEHAGANIPLTAIHEQLLVSACQRGFADSDNSAVIEAFR